MAHKKKTTRSSLVYCQENFSCRNEKSEAVITCVECGTSQCESCDTSIHGNERHRYHKRKHIENPKEEELCQHGRCGESNYCDVWCEQCRSGFCYTCDSMKHKQKKKLHQRISFKTYQAEKNTLMQRDLSDGFNNVTLEENGGSDQAMSDSPTLSDFVSCDAFGETTPVVSLKEASRFTESKTSLPDVIDNHSLDAFTINDPNKHVQSFVLVDNKECFQVK